MDGIAIVDKRFASFVLPNAPLQRLGEGFGWVEGPVWFADWNALLFSDIPNDRIMRWTPDGGMVPFRAPSGFANGQTRDREGRLISCSHHGRCLTRTEHDGSVRVIASHHLGKRLSAPNDVVVASDGSIWFTDPHYGIQTDYEGGKAAPDLPPRVYRLDPASGALEVVADDLQGPNGLAFSPDESRLYVVETGTLFDPEPTQHIRVYDVGSPGRLRRGRIFHTVAPGNADGIRCDEDGNLWSSAGDGVHVLDPSGALLGKILVPSTVSNLTFGGRHRSRLFICASHAVYAIFVNRRGAQRP